MITRLKINNYKSHKETTLNLGSLTAFTGLNSAGKSSAIQPFLLLRQSHQKGRLISGLDLNEPYVDVGRGNDALFRYANKSEVISFEISTSEGSTHLFEFDAKDKYNDSFIPWAANNRHREYAHSLPFLGSNFQYLSASRIASVDMYPIDSYAVEIERQISRFYGRGELVAHFLEYYGNSRNYTIKSDFLLHPDSLSRNLLDQVVCWEREISPRITFVTRKSGDKITIDYGYKSESENPPLEGLKAANIGFGVSYSLAIIVAILSSEPGTLLLIENPEAHIHPKGQSKLAKLMCLAARSGIQIILETHSDHIFNGLRVGLKRKEIFQKDLSAYYFAIDEDNISCAIPIEFSQSGRIKTPIQGMFDQFDNDLDVLLDLDTGSNGNNPK